MADICTNSKFEKLKAINKDSQVLQLDLFIRSDSETILRLINKVRKRQGLDWRNFKEE